MQAIATRRHIRSALAAMALPLTVTGTAAGAAEVATAQTPPAAGKAPPAAGKAIVPIDLPYDRFTLSNGLTVIVHTDRSTPTAFVGLWYGVGAKDEPAGRTGFAHLFEHLMFQPTPHRKDDYTVAIAALGGSAVNGQTTGDFTTFHETVPTGALDRTLWLEADRMAHLGDGIGQEVLDRQRDVVKNEKRQGELQPGAVSRARLLSTLYPPGHPYAHDPIGSMADLDRATLAQVKRWFAAYYGAGNAVLVLSGDIDLATARGKVARFFDAVPAGPRPAASKPWTTALGAIRRETVRDAIPQAVLTRTWIVPTTEARDLALLQLAAATLTTGRDAPLQRAMVADGGPALGVGADVTVQQLVSTMSISVTLRPGAAPGRAGALLDATLARYMAKGPDPRALPAILLPADAQLLQSLDAAAGVGQRLGTDMASSRDPAYVLKQRQWYAAASAGALRAVAMKWLSRPYHQLVTIPGTPAPPQDASPAPSPKADAESSPAASVASSPVAKPATEMPPVATDDPPVVFPPISETTLPNGLRLVVAERHRLPFVQFAMRFPAGRADAPAAMPDTADLAFGLMPGGTTKRDEISIERDAGSFGLSIGTQVDDRSGVLRWSTLTATLEPSLALVADILNDPVYPSAVVERQMAEDETRRAAQAQQGNAPALLRQALWGSDHPLGRIAQRSPAAAAERGTLAARTRQAIVDFHRNRIVPAGATLYAVGDITPQHARTLAERWFGTPARAMTPAATLPPPAAPPPRIILVDAPGAAQSVIAVGALVRPFDPARAPAETLADTALAGAFSSRLNTALRDARGWTYDFGGGIASARDLPRAFSAAGSVETERTADAMSVIRSTMAEFAGTRPLTQSELDGYRAAAIRALPARLGSGDAVLGSIMAAQSLGLPPAYAQGAGPRLAAVTLPQARQAAADLYHADAMTWVIVGDLRRIEANVRALKLAPVEVRDAYGHRIR